MTDADIAKLIGPVLKSRLRASGLKRISVASGEDYEGNPILVIDLFFEGRKHPVDNTELRAAIFEARSKISAIGETRFPYLQLHIPDPDKSLAA